MALTHNQWLGRNLMKHHRTERSIALKTKEELARELEKLLDTDIHNIADKNRWMLDMDPADVAVMSMRETQYAIFELKASQTQDKAVEERTNGKTKDFKKYCNILGMCVPTMNVFEHEGCIEECFDGVLIITSFLIMVDVHHLPTKSYQRSVPKVGVSVHPKAQS